MNAEQRRQMILKILDGKQEAISAAALARELKVSRQIIVGDIALLRASGRRINATPKGYVMDEQDTAYRFQVACIHDESRMEDELLSIVDQGGSVEDVMVEHPVYGLLVGRLQLNSRYDVKMFVEQSQKLQAKSLSLLTDGIHIHTIRCESEEAKNRIISVLKDKKYLVE